MKHGGESFAYREIRCGIIILTTGENMKNITQGIWIEMKSIFDSIVEHYHDDINHDLSFLSKHIENIENIVEFSSTNEAKTSKVNGVRGVVSKTNAYFNPAPVL